MTFIIITGLFTQFSQSNSNECLSKEDAIKRQYLERLKGCNSTPLEVLQDLYSFYTSWTPTPKKILSYSINNIRWFFIS